MNFIFNLFTHFPNANHLLVILCHGTFTVADMNLSSNSESLQSFFIFVTTSPTLPSIHHFIRRSHANICILAYRVYNLFSTSADST